jgi:hypothetical protein
MKTAVEHGINKEKLVVIYNGVSIPEYDKNELEISHSKSEELEK